MNPIALLFFPCDNAIFARSPIGGNYRDNKLQALMKLSPGEEVEKKPKQKKPSSILLFTGEALKENGSCT